MIKVFERLKKVKQQNLKSYKGEFLKYKKEIK